MKNKNLRMHSGIYRFTWPYLGVDLIRDDNGEVKVYQCEVELRVGQEEDMREGKLITVVVTSYAPPGVQSFIENIATKVRIAFFDKIFHENHWDKPVVPEESIRWIEQHLYSQGNGEGRGDTSLDSILEVTMIWDAKRYAYGGASWKPIK
ncbi:hypothetical protein MKZ21_30650 [Paenibacillus sp. FSL P2-0536]|uniref:hypothetical protein n=1 Tax=Paenibacillus sp. FSL P2-0536 TaxID=2921629 RepID=UPI0030F4B9FD